MGGNHCLFHSVQLIVRQKGTSARKETYTNGRMKRAVRGEKMVGRIRSRRLRESEGHRLPAPPNTTGQPCSRQGHTAGKAVGRRGTPPSPSRPTDDRDAEDVASNPRIKRLPAVPGRDGEKAQGIPSAGRPTAARRKICVFSRA